MTLFVSLRSIRKRPLGNGDILPEGHFISNKAKETSLGGETVHRDVISKCIGLIVVHT